MSANLPSYAELIAVLENSQSVRSINMTEKRVTVLVKALRIADAGLVDAIEDLLNYTGGWDLPLHGDHPISKARAALAKAGMGSLPITTEHPPCQAMAPVERFDLHKLDANALQLLRQLRNGPIEGDNFEGHKALATLKAHGLVETRRPGGRPTIVATITALGKAAR